MQGLTAGQELIITTDVQGLQRCAEGSQIHITGRTTERLLADHATSIPPTVITTSDAKPASASESA